MAGLLDSLDGLLSVQVDMSASMGSLGSIVDAVGALQDGPDVLVNLRQSIATLPLPAGLEGIGELATRLQSLPGLLSFDTADALLPVLAPITGLHARIQVSATGSIGGIVELLRAGLTIATGRQHGGPQGMPGATALPQQQKPTIEEIKAAAVQARLVLQQIGPFDAPTLLDRLLRAAQGFQTPLVRFMPVPLIDDLLEPLATIESWRGKSGPELATSLGRTLGLLARILDLPTTRVAQPLIDASDRIHAAAANMPQLVAQAQALALPDVPNTAREAVRDTLGALATALNADRGPFSALRELPNDLIQARLAAVRAAEPPLTIGPIMSRVRSMIAEIPPAGDNPLADVAQAITEFDLSTLTDALGALRDAIDEAVAAAETGREAVRDAITDLLQPVDDAVAAAVAAFDLDAVEAALADVPAQLQAFVDDIVEPAVAPVRAAIVQAIGAISDVSGNFDPSSLIEPIREKMEAAAELISDPQVAAALQEVADLFEQCLGALSQVDLSAAADEVVNLLGELEDKVRQIDPKNIPDPVKPPLREAVDYLTGIDVETEVAVQVSKASEAASGGIAVALREVDKGLEELKMRIEKFRPSVIIAASLGAPFASLRGELEGFAPSQLFGALQSELASLAARANVIDSAKILAPLRAALDETTGALDAVRPGNLLKPVNAAIDEAIANVLDASHFNDVFEGITDIVKEVTTYVDLAHDLRDVLTDAAALFSSPGDGEQAVRDFVEEALDRLDPLAIADLSAAFDAIAAANARSRRDAIAGRLVPALRQADAGAMALAGHAQLGALSAAVTGLADDPETRAAHAAFRASLESWKRVRDDIDEVAGALFERLEDYQLAEIIDGGSVLDPLMQRPATIPALKDAIRPALEEAVREPLLALNAALAAISPYLAAMAGGLAALIGAAHAKMDSITGAQGVGGVVGSLDTLVDQLRNFDLAPISDPVDAIVGRVQGGVESLALDGLGTAIDGANQTVQGLFELDRIIPADQISALDGQYQGAVQRLLQLDPSAVISGELDPTFKALMADVLPLFDLPADIRELSDAAIAALAGSLTVEVKKVEAAFDAVLRAIPLQDTGGGKASVSVSASVAVG
jgi:hypothetical protein